MEEQPTADLCIGDSHIRLLGTAHVSRASAEAVAKEIADNDYDIIAIELCQSRYQGFVNPQALQHLDLFHVIRQRKAPMVTAMLALGAFQQRIAERFGIEPGAEMRAAIDGAKAKGIPIELIDREVGVTLRRVYRNVPWWQRLYLFSGLLASIVTREEICEEDVEQLKQGDLLETTFAQFAETATTIYEPLIAERDRYMAAKLSCLSERSAARVLAIVGAGHLRGIETVLRERISAPASLIALLEEVPPPRRWTKLIPWVIVALILTGFGFGFYRSPQFGMSLVMEWIVINGGLSALGALIAGGHPLTVLSAFLAAPVTSLNPTIGAGFVTALVEAYLRRPTVGDFSRLRIDCAKLGGWKRNRVARTLLVFVLSSLGSAIGTYVAGFRIGQQLLG